MLILAAMRPACDSISAALPSAESPESLWGRADGAGAGSVHEACLPPSARLLGPPPAPLDASCPPCRDVDARGASPQVPLRRGV